MLPPHRRRLRLLAAAFVTLGAVAAFEAPALAHVEAHPDAVEAGTFPVLTFVVPNERKAAATVKVEVALPEDAPFAHVSVRSQPGWQSSTTTRPLPAAVTSHGTEVTDAVSVITWTGGSIPPGEFAEFAIEVGPVPENASRLTFGAIQTYSDGTEVRWIEPAVPGEPEPEQPAPAVQVRPAGSGTAAAGAPEPVAQAGAAGPATAATVLAACALGFALVAAVAAVAALARRRRVDTEAASRAGREASGGHDHEDAPASRS